MTEETTEKIDLAEIMRGHLAQLQDERESSAYSLLDTNGYATIATEDHADLVVKEYADLEAEVSRIASQHTARLARLATKKRSLDFLFMGPLEQWTAKSITKKRKSVILPHGTVGFRMKRATTKTTNPEMLRKWAEKNLPVAINWDKAPVLSSLVSEWEKGSGQLAPGRVETSEEEVFSIKSAKIDEEKTQ